MNKKLFVQNIRFRRIAVVVLTLVVVVACSAVLVASFSKSSVRTHTQPVISWATTYTGAVLPASNVSDDRTFEADSAADGDFNSCWCVNTEQDGGAGAMIGFWLEKESIVSGVMLVNGNVYLPEEGLYKRNGQVKNFTLTFSDGSTKTFQASYNDDGSCEYQYFDFDKPVLTSYVKLTVDEGYVGEKFAQNVCITEFDVYRGKPTEQQATEMQPEPTENENTSATEAATEAVTQEETEAASGLVNDRTDLKNTAYVSYHTPSHAGVNVRKSPSSDSALLTTLPEGTPLVYYPDTVTGDYVYCIFASSDDVTEGWIMAVYVKDEDEIRAVYRDYRKLLQEAEYASSGEEVFAAVEDIDGDEVPELLVSGWDDSVVVFTYDSEEKTVREVVRKEMGKGYNLIALYNKALHRVVFPSASTGGEVYEILEFTPDGVTQYLLLEYENGKFTENGEEVYKLDGRPVAKSGYQVQQAVLKSVYTRIDKTTDRIIQQLEELLNE